MEFTHPGSADFPMVKGHVFLRHPNRNSCRLSYFKLLMNESQHSVFWTPFSKDFTQRHRRCKFIFPFQQYVPFTLLNPYLPSSSSPLTLSSFSGSAVLFYGTSTTSNAFGSQDSTLECFINNISIHGSFDPLTTSEYNWILCGSGSSQFQDGPHLLTVKANVSNQQTFLVRSVCSNC